LRFLHEAATSTLIRDPIGGQHLDRDVARETGIASAINLSHAPGADQTEYFVAGEPRTRLQGHVCERIIRARCMQPAHEVCRIARIGRAIADDEEARALGAFSRVVASS